jgi:hypothetical protein
MQVSQTRVGHIMQTNTGRRPETMTPQDAGVTDQMELRIPSQLQTPQGLDKDFRADTCRISHGHSNPRFH